MATIAQHPIYHKHVRELSIVPKGIAGFLLNQIDFESWITGTKTVRNQDIGQSDRGNYTELTARWGFVPHYFDDVYAEYVELYRHQGLFLARAEVMLETAVGRFPHCQGLVPGTHRRFYNPDQVSTKLPCEKKHIALKWKLTASRDVFETDQALMVLRALDRACPQSGAHINVSSIFQGFGKRILAIPDPEDSAIVRNSLSNIVNFDLSLGCLLPRTLSESLTSGRLSMLVGHMSRLERLSCSAHRLPRNWTPQIWGIFGNNTRLHLTTLEIGRWYVLSSELADQFHRQNITLCALSLSDIFMIDGSWQEVVAELQGGVLKRFRLQHLGSPYDVTLCDCNKSYEEDLPKWHPLYRIIFLYDPWTGTGYSQACLQFRQMFRLYERGGKEVLGLRSKSVTYEGKLFGMVLS